MTASTEAAPARGWAAANHRFLLGELARLRLLLRRRILWLRRGWAAEASDAFPGLVITDAEADRLLAGEPAEDEALLYAEDASASRSIRAAGEAARRAWPSETAPPALDQLASHFALSRFERDTLLLCLGPELDPGFERLYAYVQDDATRRYPTPHLAVALLAAPGPERGLAWTAFLREAPLRRHHLLRVESGSGALAGSALRLEERVAGYLLGAGVLDQRVADLLRPVIATALPPQQAELAGQLAARIRGSLLEGHFPPVNLIGPLGSGRRGVARALCDRLGLGLFELDPRQLPGAGPERADLLRLVEREALLEHFAVYIQLSGSEAAGDAQLRSAEEDVVDRLALFLLLGSGERCPTSRPVVAAWLARPDTDARHTLWIHALEGVPHALNGEVEHIAEQFDFPPEVIGRVVHDAAEAARLRDGGGKARLAAADLWQACRRQATGGLSELARRIVPVYTWADIVLPDDVQTQLHEIADQVGHRAKVYGRWGFGAKLSRGRGISALFAGPSGTGKTMAAEILANHLHLDLYHIDLAGVVSKYIGETEKNLRRVFDAAEQSGAILFFDEADALFGKRSEVKDSHDRYANIEIDYLLQRMEEYGGLAVLATNMKSHLDQAFLRRLRFVVEFPFPNARERLRIWEQVFPATAGVEGLDLAALARLDVPGGSIRNIALNAAFLASAEERPIGMPHLMRAAQREYAKMEKLVTAAEFGPLHERVHG